MKPTKAAYLLTCAVALASTTFARAEQRVVIESYDETIGDALVTFKMIAVPSATFQMGSPESEAGRAPNEGPQHPVQVSDYWLGEHEVTWDEYNLYRYEEEHGEIDEAGKAAGFDAIARPTPFYSDETFGFGVVGYPAINMTQNAARQYCAWLAEKTGKPYRLPTEAEWENAARGGATTTYFFGNDPAQLDQFAWYAVNSEQKTHVVKTKQPSPWGFYDILGNAGEWVLDKFDEDFYAAGGTIPVVDPVSKPFDVPWSHAARGGSFQDQPAGLRSARRFVSERRWSRHDPNIPVSVWWHTDAPFVGIRVARGTAN